MRTFVSSSFSRKASERNFGIRGDSAFLAFPQLEHCLQPGMKV